MFWGLSRLKRENHAREVRGHFLQFEGLRFLEANFSICDKLAEETIYGERSDELTVPNLSVHVLNKSLRDAVEISHRTNHLQDEEPSKNSVPSSMGCDCEKVYQLMVTVQNRYVIKGPKSNRFWSFVGRLARCSGLP